MSRQRAERGRGASAGIVRLLRAALESGRAFSYEELAAEAGCTTRTVRNYLREHEALGIDIDRTRGATGEMQVRLRRHSGEATIEALGRVLAREMLRRIFPIEGTGLERAPRVGRAQIVVMARGAYEYREQHLRALRDWLNATSLDPRRPVRFYYHGTSSGPGDRIAWPIGVVVRDLARVYLAGVPEDATDKRDVRTYALERLRLPKHGRAIELLPASEAGAPPPFIDAAAIEDAIDAPFSVYPADQGVTATVRFTPEQAVHITGRRWHRKQRMRQMKDGTLEVTLGPADPGEFEAWIRQWGESCRPAKVSYSWSESACPTAKQRRPRRTSSDCGGIANR